MRAPAFDDLLDEQLAAAPSSTSAREWKPGPAAAGAAYGFFFTASQDRAAFPAPAGARAVPASFRAGVHPTSGRPADAGTLWPSAGDGNSARIAVGDTIDAAVTRRLSSRDRAALAEMEALGARLSPDFTFGELRRAFRALALEYHPDRHTGRSAREQAQLGQLFTRAREAYRVLAAVAARVH